MALTHPKFMSNLQLIGASNDNPVLKKFSKGDGVRLVQEALKQILGVEMPASTLPDGTMDGDYGDETKETVKIFQTIHDLDDDGRVGKNTLKKLEEELFKNVPKPAPPAPPPIVNLPTLVTKVIQSVSAHHQKAFNFSFARFPKVGVGDALFTHVVQLIRSNRVRIKHDPSLGGTAKYFIEGNVLAIGNLEDEVTNNAVIFHECIHALLDSAAIPINDAYSEALAYIGQCIYTIQKAGVGLPGQGDLLIVIEKANKIAERVIKFHATPRKKGEPFEGCLISEQEAQPLVTAIDNSETYKGSLMKSAKYNGIKDPI